MVQILGFSIGSVMALAAMMGETISTVSTRSKTRIFYFTTVWLLVSALGCSDDTNGHGLSSPPRSTVAELPGSHAPRAKLVRIVKVVDSFGNAVDKGVAWVVENCRAKWDLLDEMRFSEDPFPLAKAHGRRIEFEKELRIESRDEVGAIAVDCNGEVGIQIDSFFQPFRLTRVVAEVQIEADSWDPDAVPPRVQLYDSKGEAVGAPFGAKPGILTAVRLHHPTSTPVECRTCWPWVIVSARLEVRSSRVPWARLVMTRGMRTELRLHDLNLPNRVDCYAVVLVPSEQEKRRSAPQRDRFSCRALESRFDLSDEERYYGHGRPAVSGQFSWGFSRGEKVVFNDLKFEDEVECEFIKGTPQLTRTAHALISKRTTMDAPPLMVQFEGCDDIELPVIGATGKPACLGEVRIGLSEDREDRLNRYYTDSDGWVRLPRWDFRPDASEKQGDCYVEVSDHSGVHLTRISRRDLVEARRESPEDLATRISKYWINGTVFFASGCFVSPTEVPVKGRVGIKHDVKDFVGVGPFDLGQELVEGGFRFRITAESGLVESISILARLRGPDNAVTGGTGEDHTRYETYISDAEHLIVTIERNALGREAYRRVPR